MDTLVLERNNRIFFTGAAHLVKKTEDVAAKHPEWDIDSSSPFIKWIAGNFVEGDNPNSNTQFWTKDDLSMGEYSIKYSPLNMLHKQRAPIGFFLATRQTDLKHDESAKGSVQIEALSGMWSHLFPFESSLIDQANDQGQLFYSMECRGTHLKCEGPNGCGKQFDYMEVSTHCQHLIERSSIRHIVNPTFRGGAIIIPPTKPGWSEARASVLLEESLREEASLYAEQTEQAYLNAITEGRDLTPAAWEALMAMTISLAERPI